MRLDGDGKCSMAGTNTKVGRCRLTVSKPVLKAQRLWFLCLKLQYDETLSSFAFSFKLRRYTKRASDGRVMHLTFEGGGDCGEAVPGTDGDFVADCDWKAEADEHSAKVGRCRLKGLGTRVESAWCQRLKHECDDTGSKLCFQIQLAPLHQGHALRVYL